MSLKFKDEIEITTSFDNIMEEDVNVILELPRLAWNLKKEVCWGFGFFHFLVKGYEEKQIYNMFFLILDSRFKILCLVSSLIKYEQRKVIVQNYDTKSLYPMLLNCDKYLHPLVEFENDFGNQGVM